MALKKHVLWLVLISSSAAATIKGTAEFLAKATPGFLEIEGEEVVIDTSLAKVEAGSISGTFSAKVADLRTGNDTRDGHMRDYLESTKYPTIEFKLDPVQIGGGSRKAFTGKIMIHGVTKPVKGIVEFESTTAIARFTVDDITAHKVKVPTYKLYTVGKTIAVTVKITL